MTNAPLLISYLRENEGCEIVETLQKGVSHGFGASTKAPTLPVSGASLLSLPVSVDCGDYEQNCNYVLPCQEEYVSSEHPGYSENVNASLYAALLRKDS